MFSGYLIMAVPGNPLAITLIGLFTIALGNGLFKGNLQAVVGQMYDDPKYSKVRDTGYMIFYMGINIGAFFAPFVANGILNWFLKTQGFAHDGSLPAICHAYNNGSLENSDNLQMLANQVSGTTVTDLGAFANQYLDVFAKGYNYAFGIAAGAMVISMLVYIFFNKLLPKVSKAPADPSKPKASANVFSFMVGAGLMVTTSVIFWLAMDDVALGAAVGLFVGFVAIMLQISTKEERPRISSLILVFFVVIFFWMSFHQNGLTMTFFARDYTVKEVGAFTFLFFSIWSLLAFIGTASGLILLFNKTNWMKLIGIAMTRYLGP